MLSALESGEFAQPHVEQAIAQLKPSAPELFRPSAETIQLSQASTEEVDAELLGIFLEEANEVLGTINETLKILKSQPHNVELLTTIRRSFHTLKGSGRMVGLKDVGEAAWAIEQTLNHWLRQELEVGSSIFDLIGQSHAVFSVWVQHLESNSGKAPDPSNLTAFAESLRRSVDEPPPAVPTPLESETSHADNPTEEMAQAINVVTPDPVQPQEEPVQSAEIVTLYFPASPIESEENNPVIDLDATGIADFDFDAQLAEPSGADEATSPEIAPAPPVDETIEPVKPEEQTQPKVSISPTLYEIFSEEARVHLA